MMPKLCVLPTPDDVAVAGAGIVAQAAREAVEVRGRFTIALAGGNTPRLLHRKLAAEPFVSQVPWGKVHVFFGDERCVPPSSPDSNFRMACDTLIDHVPIAYDSIHRMQGEIDPQQAAVDYGRMLKDFFGDGGLDLAILGMGEDGHTASLFPDTEALKEDHHRCMANFVPKLNAWRLTMTAPFLNRSGHVLVLVTGENKAAAAQQALEGEEAPHRLPIQLIQPDIGQLTWLMDAPAAGMT